MASEEQIRVRAREMWEQAGEPDGRDNEFWYRAEEELHEAQDHNDAIKEPPPSILPG